MSSPLDIEHLQFDVEDNLREFIDRLIAEGYSVAGGQGSDPLLIDPGGKAVETWREDYPYDEPLDRDVYEEQKYLLQIELLKLQYWAQDHGERHILLFEGRDAAGKGGTIKRFLEHLNPRAARVVADQADHDRGRSVVLPALRAELPHVRGDRAVRPVLVQPGRSGARDGLLHR